MAQSVTDAQSIKQALLDLEAEYGIPSDNQLHGLLANMLDKYASQLKIPPQDVATLSGGTNKD